MFTIKNTDFYYYRQISLNITYFVILIYKGYEQLTPIYDNVSGTSKNKLSQYGHQIFNVFSDIANCLWTGVIVLSSLSLVVRFEGQGKILW